MLLLDRASVLTLSEQFQKKTRIQFLSSGKQINWYLEANPQFDPVVKAILRTYGGAFDGMTELNLEVIAGKAGTTSREAVRLLQQLQKEGIAAFEHDQHDTRLTFLVPREDDITINPLVPYIKLQEKTKREKIEQVLAYVDNDRQCKSEQLLRYFGEKETEPCGICSVCRPPVSKLDREGMKKIYFAIIGLLEEREFSSREMTEKLPFPEAHIIKVLELLVEKGALATTPANKYKLKHL